MTVRLLLLAAMTTVLAACAGTAGPDPATSDAGDVADFGRTTVGLDGEELVVAVAADPDARRRGLRGVADLGELDGMLFTWGGDTVTSGFTMRGVPIPLDIAFFDEEGVLVDVFTMPVCGEGCSSHRARGPFAFALERPAGTMGGLPPGARLEVPAELGGG